MLVPGIPWLRIGLAAAALVAAAAGGWYVEHWRLGAQIARMERDAERKVAESLSQARETERLGRLARDRSMDRAHADLQAADRGIAVARTAEQQLRDAYIRFATRAEPASSGLVATGEDATGPGLVPAVVRGSVGRDLAESLAEIGSAGTDLVAAHTRARVANEQCQREHAVAVSISRGQVTP